MSIQFTHTLEFTTAPPLPDNKKPDLWFLSTFVLPELGLSTEFTFDIVAWSDDLLTPEQLGLAAWDWTTHYRCENDRLTLIAVTLCNKNDELKPIDGIRGIINPDARTCGNRQYTGLNRFFPFSGQLLIGRDFITNVFKPGYPSPIEYRQVLELTFNEGILTVVKDFSAFAADIVEQVLQSEIRYGEYIEAGISEKAMEFRRCWYQMGFVLRPFLTVHLKDKRISPD